MWHVSAVIPRASSKAYPRLALVVIVTQPSMLVCSERIALHVIRLRIGPRNITVRTLELQMKAEAASTTAEVDVARVIHKHYRPRPVLHAIRATRVGVDHRVEKKTTSDQRQEVVFLMPSCINSRWVLWQAV